MAPCLIHVRGRVQGVGFRPQVWRLAHALGLRGWVRNAPDGVCLAVDGEKQAEFIEQLRNLASPVRIDALSVQPLAEALPPGSGFVIADSAPGQPATAIGPDLALCPACTRELFDPAGRRWRHPFIACTQCGPRYTVSLGMPYDRARTTLRDFPLCEVCAAEYGDPADRRFHAEATGCPACGPQLWLCGADGRRLACPRAAGETAVDAVLAEVVRRLAAGQILAIKGVGGFHLVCDARQPAAVATLRQRKQREAKPFAVMGLNPAAFAGVAELTPAEIAWLRSPAAPIVLCRQRGVPLAGVAPGLAWLGVMFPAQPLHLLLWHEAAGRPAGTDWLMAPHPLLLVMTSANPHGEPLVAGNDEALSRLAGIADAYLLHDRDIVARCDDAVVRLDSGAPRYLRRARGQVPDPVPLAATGPDVLAVGGFLKTTVCVTQGAAALLSPHIGSLDNRATVSAHAERVHDWLARWSVQPAAIAHDLHPDFPSTTLAGELANALGVPAIGVGHHHAHIAAICAEHQCEGPVLGLAIDGTGLGPDGTAWGGELLRVEGAACTRLGHLAPLALPGGDVAAREPWRMALAALHQAGAESRAVDRLQARFPGRPVAALAGVLGRGVNCPPTTSLGRVFDAAAGLLGVRAVQAYEGEAALCLESLALRHGPVPAWAEGYVLCDAPAGLAMLDLSPLWPALLATPEAAAGAALFHATLAAGLAAWVIRAAARAGLRDVAIGGGCALNGVLLADLRPRLQAAGLRVLEARLAPPNDGGLALGQAWVARHCARIGATAVPAMSSGRPPSGA